MIGTQSPTELFIHICSRNPIAIWAIERLLSSGPSNWCFSTWFPKQLLIVSVGIHILVIDVSSIPEWPEAVRKWTDAGQRTILLLPDTRHFGGIGLRALHLGVRGIVHISGDFTQQLAEAVNMVAKGQLFATEDVLDEFYCRSPRLRPRSVSPQLSFREQQVMDLLMQGLSNRKIGTVLEISERTAKFHVCNILRKLQVRTRRELVDKCENLLDQAQLRKVS